MSIKIITFMYVVGILLLSACQPIRITEPVKTVQPLHVSTATEQPTSTSQSVAISTPSKAISPSEQEKSVALSLVAVAENSQTTLKYDYAENIHDGRGITFGIIGFTTGTYDGNEWLHYYTKLNPDNRLAKYIPAMDVIDKGPHPNGLSENTTGLDGFITEFQASLNDPYFKQSQLDKMDGLYWNPSVEMARNLGVKKAITLAQIFDTSIQHGTDGMADIVAQTNSALGGAPKDGVDEMLWLTKLLDIRKGVLLRDPVWAESTDRVEMYRRLLQTGNDALAVPFEVTCYGDTFAVTGENILP